MSILERLARALCAGEREAMEAADWQHYLPQARAVLEAIREPDAFMAEAGANIARHIGPDESQEAIESEVRNIWRVMVDAARQ